jgi:hypothetical protein
MLAAHAGTFFFNTENLFPLDCSSRYITGDLLDTKAGTWLMNNDEPELTMLASYFVRQSATLLQDLGQYLTKH